MARAVRNVVNGELLEAVHRVGDIAYGLAKQVMHVDF